MREGRTKGGAICGIRMQLMLAVNSRSEAMSIDRQSDASTCDRDFVKPQSNGRLAIDRYPV